ncbi:MAG TPA: type II toxin-antitoxin system prevent-host-death family antitoxin [Rhizomicrobium sp.]|jgi:prevent-host-death family protein
MKRSVSLYEAKTHLSQLVEDAARGDVIVISKNGKPKAQLVVADAETTAKPGKRKLGQWAKLMTPEERAYYHSDQFWRDWKAMDEEIQRDFDESMNRPLDQSAVPLDAPSHVAEPSREFKWADTSSTPTPSSGRKTSRTSSAKKRAKPSKTKRTRSS